ncbi:MAG: PAS domain S-box protein [Candidatus Buchananbacteria bacterium]
MKKNKTNKKSNQAKLLSAVDLLQGSKKQLSDFIDFLPDATLAIDENKRVVVWNRAIEKMTGVSAKKMIGKGKYAYTVPFYGVARPQLMDLFWAPKSKIAAKYPTLKREGDNLVIETFCPVLNQGKGAFVWAKASPLFDSKGKLIGAIECIRDITELKSSEDELRVIFDNSSDGILLAEEKSGKFFIGNKVICKMLGYSLDELKKLTVSDIHPKESLGFVLQRFKDLVKRKISIAKDIPVRRKDGSIFYADINSSAIKFNSKRYILGMFRDVTKDKIKEKLLAESEARYRALTELAQDNIYLVDKDGWILYVNKFGAKQLKIKPEKLVGKNIKNLFPSAIAIRQKNSIDKVFKTGRPIYVENLSVFPSGPVWLSTQLTPIKDQDGRIVSVMGLSRDITLIKQVEDKLKIEKAKLQEYLDVADIILLTINSKQKVVAINKRGCELLGYSEKQIIGKNWFDNFIPKKDREKTKEVFNKILRGGDKAVSRFENSILTSSGEEKIISWHNKLIKDEKGEFTLSLSSGEDITAHRKYEEKIKRSEQKYSTIVEKSSDGVIVIQDGLIKYANQTMQNLVGYAPGDFLNKPMLQFIGPKSKKFVLERYAKRMKGLPVPQRYEFEIIKKTGELLFVETNSAIVDYEGRPADMAIIRDVTRAREIDRAKSEFISVASHQLRGPLTGIKWFSQLLIDQKIGKLSEKQIDFIQQIYDSNERMVRLVNDLLDVSHIETGQKFVIEKTPGDAIVLINKVIKDQKTNFPQKNINIELAKSCPGKLVFDFDQDKIYQVFSNLINNSIKYSAKDKKIIIGCKLANSDVEFYVRDFGFGIPAHQKKLVFQKFFRADNIATISTDGTGLGLYIAKNIIEAHGGKIWFDSEQNKGTTFYFTLPLKSKK